MKEFSIENFVRIGTFRKPHGVSGTLQLIFEPQWEEMLHKTGILLTLTDGSLIPWFVLKDGIRITSAQTALVDLEWIEDGESAKKICGIPVYLKKAIIDEDIPLYSEPEWIGFRIYDDAGSYTGQILNESNYAGNIVWGVLTHKGEQMIPFHPDLIQSVDPDNKILVMTIPPGLLEI